MSDESSNVDDVGRSAVNEDWLATGIGLLLIVLVLTGVIPGGVIP
jgi:hypothetical protein